MGVELRVAANGNLCVVGVDRGNGNGGYWDMGIHNMQIYKCQIDLDLIK